MSGSEIASEASSSAGRIGHGCTETGSIVILIGRIKSAENGE